MSKRPLILLFIKAPVRGQVKSRLSASIGEEGALDLYKNFVLDILETLTSSGYPLRICFFPLETRSMVAGWLGPELEYEPQEGSDLGERMETAFRKAFSAGHDPVVLVGSDIPDLPERVFREAFDKLQTRDMVIGPAVDGGYYLIGLNRKSMLPDLFRGMQWSTPTVFRETANAASRAGLSVHQLPLWRDVDAFDDLQDLFTRNKNTFFSRTGTMACIARFTVDGKPRRKGPAGT